VVQIKDENLKKFLKELSKPTEETKMKELGRLKWVYLNFDELNLTLLCMNRFVAGNHFIFSNSNLLRLIHLQQLGKFYILLN
jgi:hypothetical protein